MDNLLPKQNDIVLDVITISQEKEPKCSGVALGEWACENTHVSSQDRNRETKVATLPPRRELGAGNVP
jgi:hypothetical protein